MGNSITYGYGTVDQVNQVYQKLPSTAKEAKELMEQVGSDGKVRMPNGEYVDLPIFFQAAWLKFGMAFAATTLAYHAGYPGVSFNAILQTFLTTDTMVNILSNIVSQDNIKLADIDADAYAKRLFGPWTANPKIFAEAQFSQYLNTQSAASYQDLINNLTYAGLSDSGDLRNPFKGKSPPLNIALLLMLAETGQIGLLLMIIYKQQMKMSNALSMKMVALLGRHNEMKRQIMKKLSSLQQAEDDPELATELQKMQLSLKQLGTGEELLAGMLTQLKDSLKSFFQMMMQVFQTENQMNMAAARG